MIWCTVLNPALDVVFTIPEYRSGRTFTDVVSRIIPAGKGLNVARVAHELGEEVGVTGILPEFDSRRYISFLEDRGIEHRMLTVKGVSRINATILEHEKKSSSHISSSSLDLPVRLQEEYRGFAKKIMHPNDFWCFSGSLPKGFTDDCYSSLINDCSTASIKTLLDTRNNALKLGVRARPLLLKPNLAELEQLFDEQVKGVHHIALKGKRLLDMGIAYIFISLGADGMIALHKNDCLLCNVPSIEVINEVGCGDALVAGVIVAQHRQFNFTETCRLAVACGTAKAMHHDPGEISREEVWKLMEKINITAV